MKILIANIGSTSLKWRLFDFSGGDERLLHKGGFERVTDYGRAIDDCLRALMEGGHLANEEDLAGVGFKTVVAHGISGCVRLDETVLEAMAVYNSIAPAHNPPYILGIKLFIKRMPKVPLVGLFETAFYQWATPASVRYAVPERWYEAGVRRWGFHGASHKFIAERSAQLLGRVDVADRARALYAIGLGSPVAGPDLRVISCHLGGSSSITGIRNGVAIGNSLGLSPQSGLPHNNRVGDLDAFAIPFVMRRLGLSLDDVERQMCQDSGLKGISGVSNDLRDIQEAASQGNVRAQLAQDVFVHAARHWMGAFMVELGGVDALVFTAGIGENRAEIREAICAGLEGFGVRLDLEKNRLTRAMEAVVSTEDSPAKVMVIPANEELVVAREVSRYLERTGGGIENGGKEQSE